MSVSYKSSRAVKASRSVLITCNAVDKAHVLLGSSSGVPASDISVDEVDDVGVRGLWNIVFEDMMSWCLSNGMSSRWASVLSRQMTGLFLICTDQQIVKVAYELRVVKLSPKSGKGFGRRCEFRRRGTLEGVGVDYTRNKARPCITLRCGDQTLGYI